MISIYPSTEKKFDNNGIKILKPLKAIVRKEDNGDYYLDLKDTIENIDYYQTGMIIRVPTPWKYQPFRISNLNIENNKITIKAKHIYFDTKNYIINDSYVVDKNCNDALDHLNKACDVQTPFKFSSDVIGNNSFRCVRKTLEEAISTVIERWGGHLVRDNFNIEIRNKIGSDNGVVISYSKNIKKITKKEVWDNVVTKILPVGKDGLTLPETYLEVEEELYDVPYSKVIQIDQSNIVEDDYKIDGILDEDAYNQALLNDLRNKAINYLNQNKLPQINYSVEAYLKDVSDVGDIIYVKHPRCKIDIKTNVIAIEYDCILEKYTKIEFGNFKNSLKNLLSNVTSQVSDELSKSTGNVLSKLEKDLSNATNKILKLMGNSYVIYDGDKILVVDKLPKEEAKNVIIINNAGIGFSENGINGPFNSAWTIDGTLDMQTINVINLVADMIKGGTLKLGGDNNNNGIIEIYDETGVLIGKIDNTGFSFAFDDNENNFVNIVTTVKNILLSLSTKIDNLSSKTGIGTLEMISSFATTSFELKIINACQYFKSKWLFKSKTKFLKGSWLRITYEDNTYNRYKLPPLSLRKLNDVYDEMNIKSGKVTVTKRIGINENNELYLLDKEVTTTYDDIKLLLKEGKNIIQLESFPDAEFEVEYMISNYYTDAFATKIELDASINLLNDSIMLIVDEKTSAEEVKTLIEASIGEYKLEVTKEITNSSNALSNNLNQKIDKNSKDIDNLNNSKIDETKANELINDKTKNFIDEDKANELIKDKTSTLETNISEIDTKYKESVDNINKEMGTKIGETDYTGAVIIGKINDDESELVISADKLNLVATDILKILSKNGIDLTTYELTIDSLNFKVDKNGNVILQDKANNFTDVSSFEVKSFDNEKQFSKVLSVGLNVQSGGNSWLASNEVWSGDIQMRYKYTAVSTERNSYLWLTTAHNISSRYEEDYIDVPAMILQDYDTNENYHYLNTITSRDIVLNGISLKIEEIGEDFIKYGNGMMELFQKVRFDASLSQDGNMYFHDTGAIQFSQEFKQVLNVQTTVETDVSNRIFWTSFSGLKNDRIGNIRIMTYWNATTAAGYVHLRVIGKWK